MTSLPTAFIVGVNKAGTTAVFNGLAANGEVCASSVKETHFFDPLKYGGALPPLESYQRYFSPAEGQHVVLEATPGYFYGGRLLADKLREVSPTARALVVLRDPRRRAFSWWRFCRSRLLLTPDVSFAEYVDRCRELGLAVETDPDATAWRGLSGGSYAAWLGDWQDVFGSDLHIEFFEDLASDPSAAMRRIENHFGIDSPSAPLRADNVSTEVQNLGVQRAALAFNRWGEMVWRRLPGLKALFRRAYYRANASRRQESLAAADLRVLTAHYAEWNERLRAAGVRHPESWEQLP